MCIKMAPGSSAILCERHLVYCLFTSGGNACLNMSFEMTSLVIVLVEVCVLKWWPEGRPYCVSAIWD